MGKGTEIVFGGAETQSPHNGTTMVGAILVRRGGVSWSKRLYFDTSRPGGGAHVENQLMAAFFAEGAPAIQAAAGDIRITLYSHWSPCRSCLGVLRREALRMLDQVSTRTFLKVVFTEYYTASGHGGATNAAQVEYWGSEDEAKAAYAAATAESGHARVYKGLAVTGDASPIPLSKSRPRITVKKAGAAVEGAESWGIDGWDD